MSQEPAVYEIITKLQIAMKRPPRIVVAYLDAGTIASVRSDQGTAPLQTCSPAGGNERGWWSNGAYLCFKKTAVAYRDNQKRTLRTLPEFGALLASSGLVKGLQIVPVSSLD